ncbi:hypothetical protein FKV24_008025 [Lysobacter maris]|uniref:Uncharacterized protein n=1 Tax=Marilutibacter maris TaxID=1605891 RepID=A0A508AZH0_9GAMM|nr:hypothetical protein [Lysobacter maris]KAB8191346.1 hypothetical protein FKV24_008025 [Lysobacter maris]
MKTDLFWIDVKWLSLCFVVCASIGFATGVYVAALTTADAEAEILEEALQQNEERRLCLNGNANACRLWEVRQ